MGGNNDLFRFFKSNADRMASGRSLQFKLHLMLYNTIAGEWQCESTAGQISRSGGIGRRTRFRSVFLRECRFKSCLRHILEFFTNVKNSKIYRSASWTEGESLHFEFLRELKKCVQIRSNLGHLSSAHLFPKKVFFHKKTRFLAKDGLLWSQNVIRWGRTFWGDAIITNNYKTVKSR